MTALQREIIALRELRTQLKEESKIQPMLLSQALPDIVNYVKENASEDKLVSGYSSQKENIWASTPGGQKCTLI